MKKLLLPVFILNRLSDAPKTNYLDNYGASWDLASRVALNALGYSTREWHGDRSPVSPVQIFGLQPQHCRAT